MQKYLFWGVICLFFNNNTKAQGSYRNFFDDRQVSNVYITLRADSLAWLLDVANANSDVYIAAQFIFDDGVRRDTMPNVGFRLRGNTSRTSAKKSFKVKFNAFNQSGRKYQGVKETNLNSSHNDPTMIREKLFYDVWNRFGLPERRANFVKVYVNGSYFGLYTNIEEIDDEMVQRTFGTDEGNLYKCLYPADLKYINDNPLTYKNLVNGTATRGRVYDLKNNELADDYTDLARLIKVIGTTSTQNLPCELQKVLNTEGVLKAYAVEVMCGHWDDMAYNKNNYYLYQNPLTQRFEFLSYDADNSFGVDWVNQNWTTRNIYTWHNTANSRLISSMMSVPQYRKTYSYYVKTLIDSILVNLNPRIDSLKNLITAAAQADTYRSRDYGFTMTHFNGNFDSLAVLQAKFGIKQYINRRIQTARAQLDVAPYVSIISTINHTPRLPKSNESISFLAKIENPPANTSNISVLISYDSLNFMSVPLFDDGLHNDRAANDGIFGNTHLPPSNLGRIWYAIKADDANSSTRNPFCGYFPIKLNSSIFLGKLFINEFMADNTLIKDEFGEADDWVELYNSSNEPIYMGNKYLSDDFADPQKWKLPAETMQPRSYRVFWLDNQAAQGIRHANFKLAASGEQIGLFASVAEGYAPIDTFSFGQMQTNISWGKLPDGAGAFRALPSRTPNATNVGTTDTHNIAENTLKITPNPTNSSFEIRLNNPDDLPLYIEVYDINGSLREKTQQIRLNTEGGYAKGIYIVKVKMGEQVFVQKLLVF